MSLIGIKVPGASRGMHGSGGILLLITPHHTNLLVLRRSLRLQAIPELVIGTTSERPVFMVPPAIHGHRGQIIAPHNLAGILQLTLELMGPAPL